MFDNRRVRIIKPGEPGRGPIIYVMSRDQRVEDNWAMIFTQKLAIEHKQPVIVICPIAADYPDASAQQSIFMILGLKQLETKLKQLRIPFLVTTRDAVNSLPRLITHLHAGVLVTDFNPLKESIDWKPRLADRIDIPFYEVNAHNIVPCWEVTDKQEYAA